MSDPVFVQTYLCSASTQWRIDRRPKVHFTLDHEFTLCGRAVVEMHVSSDTNAEIPVSDHWLDGGSSPLGNSCEHCVGIETAARERARRIQRFADRDRMHARARARTLDDFDETGNRGPKG